MCIEAPELAKLEEEKGGRSAITEDALPVSTA